VKSDGLHSNGYSLINLLIKEKKIKLNDKIGNKYLKDLLIKPTKIYTNLINLKNLKDIKSMANITGGGLSENIPRVLSNKTSAIINKNLLCRSSLYKYIVEKKIISQNEMYKTFNCGIGMVLIVSNSKANLTVKNLKKIGFSSSIIGHVQKSKFKKVFYENNL
jgi:phosphoribosylformylglycinamidine cyclo-ligase